MISCSIYLIEWMITLFSTREISIAAYIWDQVFIYGEFHILRVAVAISKLVEEALPKDPEAEGFDVQHELKHCDKYLTKKKVAQTLTKLKEKVKYSYIEALYHEIQGKLESMT